ncbi:calcium binding modulator protein-like protein [Calycina marina]|uniref:Calcium binding modulator protein-like protein n=1 Tax=Calycina marina TaxID=1763456 RepID=A0A9P8CD56_9HELO|nr:calcium binding modulator protein-like protein [Calycina marina]
MAYNKSFNPDSLPAFAEPERRGGSPSQVPVSAPAPSQQQQHPRPNQHPHHSQAQVATHDRQYGNKPSAPLPGSIDPHSGRRLSPQMQPPANYGYNSSDTPPPHHGVGSPPPSSYGRPPPAQNRPPQQAMSRPPPSPAPPSPAPPSPAPPNGADPTLWPLFKAVDKDSSGQLTERELRAALVNGDWSSFDPHTVTMMIRMFDSDRSGSIGFDEFCGLWGFLAAWRSLFDRFDVDHSGNISLNEYTSALVAFGYRLSPPFVNTLFKTFDKRSKGAISFDLFVQSCISLKRMTDVFKKYDDDRDGFITLSFEDFLAEIIKQR